MRNLVEPRKRAPEFCGIGGCSNAKISAGLFCAKHWGMVTQPTQKRYCDVILDGSRSAEEKSSEITVIELLALGEISAEIERRTQEESKKA